MVAKGREGDRKRERRTGSIMAGGWRLLAADFVMSLMWVWSSVVNKIIVHKILGYGAHDVKGEIVRYSFSILNMFFFAILTKVTKGGAYNPLTLLSAAISGDFSNFLFTLGARIPAQVHFLGFLFIKLNLFVWINRMWLC